MYRTFRFYLKRVAIGVAICLGMAAGLNLWVDPHWAFSAKVDDRFASYRDWLPEDMGELTRMGDGQILLIGSSRVETGIDPDHPSWNGKRAYNLGLAGASLDNIFNAIESFLDHNPKLQHVYLFVDFHQFSKNDPRRPYHESRFSPGFSWVRYYPARLFSVYPALKVLAKATMKRPNWNHPRGGMVNRPKPSDVREFFRFSIAHTYTQDLLMKNYEYDRSKIDLLRNSIAVCQARQCSVTVVINPTHAWYWESLYQAGFWDQFEQWNRDICHLVAEFPQVPLWNFSEYHACTTESVPESKPETTWFWEASHYQKTLGDLMIRRILGQDSTAFGFILTPDRLEKHIQHLRDQRKVYAESYPEDVREIGLVLRKITQP